MSMSKTHEIFARNLGIIRENIDKYSPYPEKVRLVAVSKESSSGDVRAMYELGVRDFGESRIQEFTRKLEELSDLPDISWHFIGHLQTKKVRYILGKAHLLHSLDRLYLAEKLQQRAQQNSQSIECLLQVNVAREEQKYGVYSEEIAGTLMILKSLSGLTLRGLMTMAPFTDNMDLCYEVFSKTRELFSQLEHEIPSPHMFDILSMGMSNDYIPALNAGSTMLRIGSALFKE